MLSQLTNQKISSSAFDGYTHDSMSSHNPPTQEFVGKSCIPYGEFSHSAVSLRKLY